MGSEVLKETGRLRQLLAYLGHRVRRNELVTGNHSCRFGWYWDVIGRLVRELDRRRGEQHG